jgi:hypothetical protein
MAAIPPHTNTTLRILSGINKLWRVSYPLARTSIDTDDDDMAKRPSDITANLDDERERTARFYNFTQNGQTDRVRTATA